MDAKYARILGSFEALHCWPDAPEEVKFLRNDHRHLFEVEALIQVYHNDRELEYYMVKEQLKRHLDSFVCQKNTKSCEQYADEICEFLKMKYGRRKLIIRVLEDGLEGAVCYYD